MSAWAFLPIIFVAHLVIGASGALASIGVADGSGAAHGALLQIADGAGPVLEHGDSRRPHVEVPSNALPNATGAPVSQAEAGDPIAERVERALNRRGLGTHRPGDLYLPTGEHRVGDLDEQGTFRPGDLR